MEGIDIDTLEQKIEPLWFHKRGLLQTASGFGRKLRTEKKVFYKNRWRRVYVCQISNAGTAYIIVNKEEVTVY